MEMEFPAHLFKSELWKMVKIYDAITVRYYQEHNYIRHIKYHCSEIVDRKLKQINENTALLNYFHEN